MVSSGMMNGGVGPSLKHRNTPTQAKPPYVLRDHPVHRFLWTASLLTLGLLNWIYFLLVALWSGTFFTKSTEKEINEYSIAQDVLWNLGNQPVPGFHHDFFTTRTGFQFHFITNAQAPGAGKDLIIFIHGFPNTSMVWRRLLQEPALLTTDATLVAVDLPGYGGSDSMARYDSRVLEELTDFIVAMRERYGVGGDSLNSTIAVGHDWGCIIAMRLATEAPCLADRFVLINGPLPELSRANIERALLSSRRIFKQFQVSPWNNFGCLAKSFQTIKPLLYQVLLSGYIFAFHLPALLVKPLFDQGNLAFLRGCLALEHTASKAEYKLHDSKAACLGPTLDQCKTKNKNGSSYGPTVAQRTTSFGNAFWQSTAYYRDGLVDSHWEKSIETVAALYDIDRSMSFSQSPSRRRSSSASSAIFDNHVKGSLRAPATLIWGESDRALSRAICLDGIGDYLAKDSEVFLLAKATHWPQVDCESRTAVAHIISMFANGPSMPIPSYIAKDVVDSDAGISLMLKK